MTEVRKACLSAVPADVVEQAIVPVPRDVMTSPESGSRKSADTSHTLDLVCGKITIHDNEQTSMYLKKKKDEISIRSSAAEYLTYVASIGDQQDSIE